MGDTGGRLVAVEKGAGPQRVGVDEDALIDGRNRHFVHSPALAEGDEAGVQFARVFDGLSNTLMLGETLPAQCIYQCAYCINFPIAGTSIRAVVPELVSPPSRNWSGGCGRAGRSLLNRWLDASRSLAASWNSCTDE